MGEFIPVIRLRLFPNLKAAAYCSLEVREQIQSRSPESSMSPSSGVMRPRTWHPQGPIHPQPHPVPLHFGDRPTPRRWRGGHDRGAEGPGEM